MKSRKSLRQPPFAFLGPRGFLRPGKNEEHQYGHDDDDHDLLRTKQYGQHDELLHALWALRLVFLAIERSITYNQSKPV